MCHHHDSQTHMAKFVLTAIVAISCALFGELISLISHIVDFMCAEVHDLSLVPRPSDKTGNETSMT